MANSPCRKECYAEVRRVMKEGVLSYYRANPDRLGDGRSQDAIRESMHGLQAILAVLDRYDIRRKADKP